MLDADGLPRDREATMKTTANMTAQQKDEIEADVDRLIEDARAVRSATSVLKGAAPANRQRYQDQVARTLAIMEVDLGLARATLFANEASTSEDLRDTMHEVSDATQRWLDELAVRTHLFGMDARDRVDELAHRLDRARGEIRRAVSRIDDAIGSDLDSMRRLTVHSIRDVAAAMRESIEAIYHYVE
jgi:hypothetical protein